jgi:hypothetical protein
MQAHGTIGRKRSKKTEPGTDDSKDAKADCHAGAPNRSARLDGRYDQAQVIRFNVEWDE